jgi:adenosylcobinamide-GDP ribazoletransferase
MTALSDLRGAVAFLTVIGRGSAPSSSAMGWFPVVGALVGTVVGLAWWGANEVWGPLLAATVAVGVDLAITGALHHDGLADTADGLLPHLEPDRRLEVMRTPDVGAFAVVTVVVVVLLRVGALASMEPDVVLVAGVWCASRTAMVLVARTLPYARTDGGLASAFLGRSPIVPAAVGVALSTALLAWFGWPALAAAVALVVVSAAVAWMAHRRIGGFTGDVLGAVGVLGETAALLTLAARW